MKKSLLISLLLLIFSVSTYAFQIILPETTVQGAVLTVLIEEGLVYSEVEVSIGRGEEIFSRSQVFKINITGDRMADIALLGIPSTLDPGVYTVTAQSEGGLESQNEIQVISKKFIKEDIPLSRSMSDLRQSDDIRKAEQWRNLLLILRTVDIGNVFETGSFKIPVEPLRTSSFYGDRRTFRYDDGTTARSIHNGIDYSAETGTPVYAAGDGRVVFAGERIISGNTAVIEHLPGVYSLYYHMDSLTVSEGILVAAGAQVGTVGLTGLATGAHLHWEVRVAGVAVDPGPLMSSAIIDKDLIISNIEGQ